MNHEHKKKNVPHKKKKVPNKRKHDLFSFLFLVKIGVLVVKTFSVVVLVNVKKGCRGGQREREEEGTEVVVSRTNEHHKSHRLSDGK